MYFCNRGMMIIIKVIMSCCYRIWRYVLHYRVTYIAFMHMHVHVMLGDWIVKWHYLYHTPQHNSCAAQGGACVTVEFIYHQTCGQYNNIPLLNFHCTHAHTWQLKVLILVTLHTYFTTLMIITGYNYITYLKPKAMKLLIIYWQLTPCTQQKCNNKSSSNCHQSASMIHVKVSSDRIRWNSLSNSGYCNES